MKRIGFIGAGKHAQSAHLPSYANNGECELAAIADIDFELAKAVAARFGIPTAYRSHTDLLTQEKLDAVVATLPQIPQAAAVLCDLLTAKVPVCAEKPLAFSVPAAERIVRTAEKSGTLFRVAYHKRSDPATMFAKREIDRFLRTGEIGRMRYARVHASLAGDWIAGAYRSAILGTATVPPSAIRKDDFAGMSDKAMNAFNMIASANSHQFDLMRHLLGEPYRVAYADPTGVLLAVESAHGVPAVFEFSPYNSTKDWIEYGVVAFERGYVKVTLPPPLAINRAGTVEVFRDDGGDSVPSRTLPVFPYKSAMQSQSENFIAALSGKPDPMCTAAEALESLAVSREWAMRLHPVAR